MLDIAPLDREAELRAALARRQEERAAQDKADLEELANLEKARIAALVEKITPLQTEYDALIAQRAALNVTIASKGTVLDGLKKGLPPTKTVVQNQPVATVQRAALSPVKNAIVPIRGIDCKNRTINGVIFKVLKDNPDVVVNLPTQETMTIAEYFAK